MSRLFEYYIFVAIMSVAAICVLYVILLPLPHRVVLAQVSPHAPIATKQKFITPKSGIPAKLVIPSLGMDMAIKVGTFDLATQSWTLSDTDIFYADASVPSNDNNGVTLLYGHARWGVFGALPDLAMDATAEIYTDTGLHFEYRYTSVQEVDQFDVGVFTTGGKPKLVLQTCTGLWDSHRALYSFDLVGEKT